MDEEVGCARCRGERGRAREGGAWARGRGRALNGMRVAGDRVLVCEPVRISGPGEVLGGGGGGEGGGGDGGDGPSGGKRFLDWFRGVGAGFDVQREEEVRRSGIRTPPGLPGRGSGHGTKLAAIAESEGEEVAQSMDGVADGSGASDEAVAGSESDLGSRSGASVETVIARSLMLFESDAGACEDEGVDVDVGMEMDHKDRSLSSDATIDKLDSQNNPQMPGSLPAATDDSGDSEMADIHAERNESLSSTETLDGESMGSEMPDIYANAQRVMRAQLEDPFSGVEAGDLAGRGR